MSITRLHHAQITIPRGAEEQGREFYCTFLGLPEIEKPEALRKRGGFWLQVGDRQVHVGTEDGVERAATKAHLAYEVTDLEAWRERLQQRGIAILEGVPIPGYIRFEIRDPFGNRVEFIQPIAEIQS
ncbi:MAG: VOC family protein [Ktedonobacteraceae bacterium]|nr:VOC family protein [Ktedonobacteraceae bacterium]